MTAKAALLRVPSPVQRAIAMLGRGEVAQAERLLRKAVTESRGDGAAWNLLSIIANGDDRADEALAHATTALDCDAGQAEFHFSQGRALKSLGRLDDAALAYERAIALRPDFADVRVSLGIVRKLQGRFDEAAQAYREALRLRPSFPEALSNLGNVLVERLATRVGELLTAEDLREAEQVQRRALELSPGHPNLLHNLGLVLKLTGRYEEAAEMFNRALAIDSRRVDICMSFGELLFEESRFDLARQLFERWLADHPPRAEVMLALVANLVELGDNEAALQWLDRVEAMADVSDPAATMAAAQHLRGRIRQQRLQVDLDARAALASFDAALRARPDYFEGACSYLMTFCYLAEDPQALLAMHRSRMAPVLAAQAPAVRRAVPRVQRAATPRLRIGFVSFDFKRHSVAYFLEGLLEALDRRRFEIHAYQTHVGGDEVTARLRGLCDGWHEVAPQSDAQIASRVMADGIDILVDLSGLTSGSRLGVFAHRPAPLQLTWLGYPTTTGADCFDFRLSDVVIDPPQAPGHSTEPLWRLPGSMFCYRPGLSPEVAPPPALADGIVRFGSFNNFAKAGEHTLALWRDVLRAVPGSRLVLKAGAFLQEGNRQHLRRHFEAEGIAAERIVFKPWTPDVQAHLATYNDVDIALDTFPFNGATTTCEALWMGAPVVSMRGRTHPSRMGASILAAAGRPEWVADDDAGYRRIALDMASDLPRLAAWRAAQRPRLMASRLFDKEAFARDFEAALVGMLAAASHDAAVRHDLDGQPA